MKYSFSFYFGLASMLPDSSIQLPSFLPSPNAMLFNSAEYLLFFLPFTVLMYFWLNRRAGGLAGKSWLVLASLFFYSWWSISYLWLIGGSMFGNYIIGTALARWQHSLAKQLLLSTAIVANLVLLGYYKYADFFITNLNHWTTPPLPLLQMALPLGISFFTFTQVAFLVDVYCGKAREYNPIHYALFVTYFPHLIAGPILHHAEMMPQFSQRNTWQPNWENIRTGLFILSLGLLKKIVLADSLSAGADTGFNSTTPLPFHQAWIASLSYTLQLYFDFSGYTDMAIGASLLFNIRLPENFNSPYKATNIREFWLRWHMTLSRWLRDYLYIPLGGSQHGIPRTYAALLITFLLGGLWHGASWTFVIWGALHGVAAILHRFWQRTKIKIPPLASMLITFVFVNTAWIFFRADSIPQAMMLLRSMAGLHGFSPLAEFYILFDMQIQSEIWNIFFRTQELPARQMLLPIPCLLLVFLFPNTAQLANKPILLRSNACSTLLNSGVIGIALFCCLFIATSTTHYIYFYF